MRIRGGGGGGGGGAGLGVLAALVGALVLLHVVLAGEGLVAGGAVDVLLARVFLAVPGGVARGGEGVGAADAGRVRARVFLLADLRRVGVGWRCRGRGRVVGGGGGCGDGGLGRCGRHVVDGCVWVLGRDALGGHAGVHVFHVLVVGGTHGESVVWERGILLLCHGHVL